jgi:hypothetical protein
MIKKITIKIIEIKFDIKVIWVIKLKKIQLENFLEKKQQ